MWSPSSRPTTRRCSHWSHDSPLPSWRALVEKGRCTLGQVVAHRWPVWILTQLPLGAPVGLIAAGLASYREMGDEELFATQWVKVAVPPASRFTLEVEMSPVPEAGQDEPSEAEQVQVTPDSFVGKVSATVAPLTSEGPLLVTTIV